MIAETGGRSSGHCSGYADSPDPGSAGRTGGGTYNPRMNGSRYASVFDVAVVGRAAVGLAASLALARVGLRVAVVGPDAPGAESAGSVPGQPGAAGFVAASPHHAGGWDNRVFALSPASRALLESIGSWQAMDTERIAPVHDMRIWPEPPGSGAAHEDGHGAFAGLGAPKALHFSAWQAQVDALAWIVENRNLTRALSQASRFAGFAAFDSPLVSLDTESDASAAQLGLADGRKLKARLVVGADGANSRVRELAGIGGSLVDYPQRAVVANFDTELPHRDCAYQWFGEHGILALLPLPAAPGGVQGAGEPPAARPAGRCSIVWSAPHALADELLALEPQALAERVEATCGAMLGRMVPIGPAAGWPLRLGKVDALVARRVALVGDAAHVVHPLAGQGMNLGFGDVQALADTLREREVPRDPGERGLLRRYERARAEPVLAMRLATDGLQKLFDPESSLSRGPFGAPLAALRGLGFRAVARSGLLRRLLVSHAIR
ncbi:FAD-dependent monooxygenase [Burkholderiaceae bacterium FT117]|uniref:FAD-dependent monooxygenase n=1 Tax=Zeimonas sediminis TaxID=2944268 RepID=UPI002342DD1B|nr:FAD-dependent monooxygenase [Zeimonas sediminis]MCM5571889.1 FAD-dependent monooxygenase [Zeimonas sediminis]